MARTVIVVGAVVAAVFGLLFQQATSSAAPSACSADETWDPVAASDVIVGGQIVGYEEVEGREFGTFVAVGIRIRVDHVWKGAVGGEVVIDRASLLKPEYVPDGVTVRDRWAGGAGACGAFDHDPTGKYAVLGLWRDGGELRTNRLTTFYLDAAPYDPAKITNRSNRTPIGLPVAGRGENEDFWPNRYANTIAVIGLMAVTMGAWVRRSTRRKKWSG